MGLQKKPQTAPRFNYRLDHRVSRKLLQGPRGLFINSASKRRPGRSAVCADLRL